MMQLLQPAREDGVRGGGGGREGGGSSSSCQHTRATFSLDPLTDLRSVEIVQVTLASAASRVDSGDGSESCLHMLLAQQLAECIQNDAIADAEEEMERSGHDALRRDREQWTVRAIYGMAISGGAIARGVEEIVLADDADG